MKIKSLITSLLLFGSLSCSSAPQQNLINKGTNYISQCEEYLTHQVEEGVGVSSNFSYVYFFQRGVIVTFTKGEVGSFTKRDENYKQILACGFYQGKLVRVKSPQAEPVLNIPVEDDFEDYNVKVMELLFKRVGGRFEYCCQQVFNPSQFNDENTK